MKKWIMPKIFVLNSINSGSSPVVAEAVYFGTNLDCPYSIKGTGGAQNRFVYLDSSCGCTGGIKFGFVTASAGANNNISAPNSAVCS